MKFVAFLIALVLGTTYKESPEGMVAICFLAWVLYLWLLRFIWFFEL